MQQVLTTNQYKTDNCALCVEMGIMMEISWARIACLISWSWLALFIEESSSILSGYSRVHSNVSRSCLLGLHELKNYLWRNCMEIALLMRDFTPLLSGELDSCLIPSPSNSSPHGSGRVSTLSLCISNLWVRAFGLMMSSSKSVPSLFLQLNWAGCLRSTCWIA